MTSTVSTIEPVVYKSSCKEIDIDSHTAIIVSNGPSASAFRNKSTLNNCIIGVRGAAAHFECDYWVISDYHGFELTKPIGNPIIFTHQIAYEKIRTKTNINDQARSYEYEYVLAPPTLKRHGGPYEKSGCLALYLCYLLGFQEVVAYGVDMDGTQDIDGENRHGRHIDRWTVEKQHWQEIADKYEMAVTRIDGDGKPIR